MHFRIKRIKLLNALAKATRAVSVRSPLPVLTGIKFDLQAHQLILTGSDSDITIQTIIDEDDDLVILKEGAVVLNSRYIFDIVRKINSDDIEIEIIDGLLTRIKGSQIEYRVQNPCIGCVRGFSFGTVFLAAFEPEGGPAANIGSRGG